MEKEKKTTRSKKNLISKQKFLKAVGTVLKKEGYQKLGVNRVAEVAGIDKSSLYYHFGSFDNLLEQYILANDYWLNVFKEPLKSDVDLMKAGEDMIIHQVDAVLGSDELQAMLLWELSDKNGLSKYIASLREEMSSETLAKFNKYFNGTEIDFEMISAILIAGIYYLILHRNQSHFCNVDINNKTHVERLKKTISSIAALLVKEVPNHP